MLVVMGNLMRQLGCASIRSITDLTAHVKLIAAVCLLWQEEMLVLMGNLMRQLECLLHEYLSFNWHHADAVLRSNQTVLQ